MAAQFNPLALAARHPKAVLVGGLAIGIAMPGLAGLMAGWIPEMIVLLLFLGALRLSPSDLPQLGSGLFSSTIFILALQLLLPFLVLAVAYAFDAMTSPVAIVLVLLACAPPIVSSPNIAAIMGLHAPSAMQYMVIGSILLPLTTLPVFLMMPALGSPDLILGAVLRLAVTIAIAGGGAILLRQIVLPNPGVKLLHNLDGVSVLALAIFVVALMPAVSGAIANNTSDFLFWLVIAFAANFGTQLLVLRFPPNGEASPKHGTRALVAGNRNISLFFVALPTELTEPLLVFLGCYQLPMLLTPVLLSGAYRQHMK